MPVHLHIVSSSFHATMAVLSMVHRAENTYSPALYRKRLLTHALVESGVTGVVAWLEYLPILIILFGKAGKKMFTSCSTFCVFEHTIYFWNESILIQGFII